MSAPPASRWSARRRRDRPLRVRRGPPLRLDRGPGRRRLGRLVGRRGRRAGAAAVEQQADPGARDGRARPRPPAGPAGAGLRVALRGAVPRRGRTPHAGVRRAGRVGAADPAGLPARRRRPRGGDPRRRHEVVDPDELLGQARRDAGDLRPEGLGHRRPTSTPTTRCRSPSSRPSPGSPASRSTTVAVDGCGAPAAVHLAHRAGARLRRARRPRPTGPSTGSPRRSAGTPSSSAAPPATSSPCTARSPA